MRGHSHQACTPSRSCHTRFVQIYALKSVREVDALKFGTYLDQAIRTAAIGNVGRQVTTHLARGCCGAQLPRHATKRV